MVRLMLDNKEVVIDDTSAIKMTKENPYFTQSGSFSMDVKIPLSIYENAKFFGNIQRLQSRKRFQMMSAKLFVDNQCILNGSATVTGVTKETVTVQLFGGNSDVNFISKYGDLYVDELLGLGRIRLDGELVDESIKHPIMTFGGRR